MEPLGPLAVGFYVAVGDEGFVAVVCGLVGVGGVGIWLVVHGCVTRGVAGIDCNVLVRVGRCVIGGRGRYAVCSFGGVRWIAGY